MHQAAYRLFDAAFVLETDSPAFLAAFDRSYARFRSADSAGAAVYRVCLSGTPEFTAGEFRLRSASADAMHLYAYNAVLNAALAQVRSHYLLHAAALVSPDGRGVILAGAAGLGKTTLTLALLERGYGFLSDDMAALGRADGLLHPFPRAVGLRPPGGQPGEKQPIDVELVASPAAPCFLFVLADPAPEPGEPRPWYAVLDRLPGELERDLRSLQDVRGVDVARREPFPALRLFVRTGAEHALERQVEAACRQRDVLLFEWVQGREAPPDFRQEPHLQALPPSEAAHEMLHHLRGGPHAALVRAEFGGSASRLYLALAGAAATMACHRLWVGRLSAMLALIDRAAQAQPSQGAAAGTAPARSWEGVA